jgi:hypothetical protein
MTSKRPKSNVSSNKDMESHKKRQRIMPSTLVGLTGEHKQKSKHNIPRYPPTTTTTTATTATTITPTTATTMIATNNPPTTNSTTIPTTTPSHDTISVAQHRSPSILFVILIVTIPLFPISHIFPKHITTRLSK